MDDQSVDPVREQVDEILIKEGMQKILDTLPERHSLIIKRRYLLSETYEEIGKILRITGARVGQMANRARRLLLHPSRIEMWRKLVPDLVENYEFRWKEFRKLCEEQAEASRKQWEEECEKRRSKQRPITIFSASTMDFPSHKQVETPKPNAPSLRCPNVVILKFLGDGTPYLDTMPVYGYTATIKRDRDPVTYDRWLEQRLNEHQGAIK